MHTVITWFRSWRRLLGICLIAGGITVSIFYFQEVTRIAKSKADLHLLNEKRMDAVVRSRLTPTPQVSPSLMLPTAVASSVPTLGAKTAASTKVKLSTATEAELETLPGIGPSKAKAIIEYRTTHGFKTLSDLSHVKGIGEKTYETLKPYIEL